MVLRRIGVLSAGKVMGITYALMGLILGGFFALLSMAGVAANAPQNGNNPAPFMAVGAFAVIIFPILYGIGGFIGGIICAAIYNVVAGMIGGLEMDFERRTDIVTAP